MGFQSRLTSTFRGSEKNTASTASDGASVLGDEKMPDEKVTEVGTSPASAGEIIEVSKLSHFKIRGPENIRSWQSWLKWAECTPSDGLSMAQMYLYSQDLRPVESYRRIWHWYHYVNIWLADAINVSSFQIAGTGMEAGLTWWETWLAIIFGYSFAAGFILLSQRAGSYYHIPFTGSVRTSFGIYGGIWPVINRVVLAIIWFSSQSWVLGQCIQLMLIAVFGRGVPDHMGTQALSGTTVFGFVSFFLGWLIQLPVIWLRPESLRHFFSFKAIVAPIAAFGLMIWALVRAHGHVEAITHPTDTLSSSAKAWAWINMFMNCLSNYATLIVNAPDFSRFANKPSSSTWSQGLTIPISFSITSLVGLFIAASSKSFTSDGSTLWNPLDLLQIFVVDGYTAGDRAGTFLIAFGLAVSQIGTNIMANILSGSIDLTSLMPRFINIRRGGYICAAIGICICPWHFYETGNTFTTYLSAYSIFLSSISGVMIADYFWLRRGKIQLYALYDNSKDSPYRYTYGVNWRAVVAYLLALVPTMPGFVGSTGPYVPIGATYVYYFDYFVGFLVAFILYVTFNMIWPPNNVPEELQGRLLDLKAPWLEEDAYVDDFDDVFRAKNRNAVPREKQQDFSNEMSRAFSSENPYPPSDSDSAYVYNRRQSTDH